MDIKKYNKSIPLAVHVLEKTSIVRQNRENDMKDLFARSILGASENGLFETTVPKPTPTHVAQGFDIATFYLIGNSLTEMGYKVDLLENGDIKISWLKA
jgi:hypothetical protein